MSIGKLLVGVLLKFNFSSSSEKPNKEETSRNSYYKKRNLTKSIAITVIFLIIFAVFIVFEYGSEESFETPTVESALEPALRPAQPSTFWSVDLSLTCDVPPVNSVAFGVNPNATSGYDRSPYDRPAPPPPPIVEYTEAYFTYPENSQYSQKLLASTLNPDDTLEWPLIVQIWKDGPWSGDVTMTWNATQIADIPVDYSLTLIDGETKLDMRNVGSYTFAAEVPDRLSTVSYSFTINVNTTD
jgi:hypothetical protein